MKKLLFLLFLFPSLAWGAVFNLTNTSTITWENDTENLTGAVVILGDLAVTAPLTGAANDIFPGATGTKATIAIPIATAAADGYLNMTDWATFNNSIDTIPANSTNDQNLNTTSDVTFGNITATTNITADFYNGDGSLLANLPGGGNASTNGTIAADYFITSDAGTYLKNSTYTATDATNWNTAFNNYLNKSNETLYLQNASIDTSAELAAIVGDETGTGVMVWNTSPSIKTPTIIGTAEATGFFNASNINATNANSTNVNVATKITMPASQVNSSHVIDYTLTGTDIANTTIDDIKRKEFNFQVVIMEPDILTNDTGRATTSAIIWTNEDTRTYTIGEVRSITDVDNYNYTLFKSLNYSNISTTADVLLNTVLVADNGEACFYNNTTTLTNATIEAGKHLIFEHNAVNVTRVKISIKGNFS